MDAGRYVKRGGVMVPLDAAAPEPAGPWWPRLSTSGVVYATSSARSVLTVSADAVAHVKGAWQTMVASTTEETTMLILAHNSTAQSGFNSSTLLDVGVGPVGAEVVVVPDLQVGYADPRGYVFPLRIPAGSRIALRTQSAVAGKNVGVQQNLMHGPANAPTPDALIQLVAVDHATSRGVVLAQGGANHAKGPWSTVVEATPVDLAAVVPSFAGGGDTALTTIAWLVDIGIGPVGSEEVIAADISMVGSASEIVTVRGHNAYGWLIPADIPAGTRIATRVQRSGSGDNLDMSLIGVPA